MLQRMSIFSLCLWLAMGTLLAYSDEVPRLTFAQLVDSLKANLEVTQKIKSYNGKEVEIQGFIIPAGPPDLSFFLLSRISAIGNYCCELSTGQDETVYVSRRKVYSSSTTRYACTRCVASLRPVCILILPMA